jgi:hypothetical protein
MALTVVKTSALSGTITNAQLAGSIDLTSKVTGTLPTGNGGTGATSFAPGKVLQALGTSDNTKRSTSSTSFVDITGLSIAITPSSTSSKIYCICTIKGVASDNSTTDAINFKLVRDSTLISEATNITYGNNDQLNLTYPVVALDSPSSTSELTYKMQFSSRLANSSSINNTAPHDRSEIVVMEIGA